MRDDHLKGWLAEARKKEREEAAAKKETPAEGKTAIPNSTGGEGTEERRGKTPAEVSSWGMVVYLVQAVFREGLLAEENM